MIGKSRQAYYKSLSLYNKQSLEMNLIIGKVQNLRLLHPKMGARKLQYLLAKFHNIRIGRDRLFNLLGEHSLLVKRKRKPHYLRSQKNNRHSNKLKEFTITRPGQVMMCDITYLKIRSRDYYLSLVVAGVSGKHPMDATATRINRRIFSQDYRL